jgi:hypothetical protein
VVNVQLRFITIEAISISKSYQATLINVQNIEMEHLVMTISNV